MKTILVISFVIVSFLSSKFESKDFCQAFKGNGFQIDYSFNYSFVDNNVFKSQFLIVIGNHFWQLTESNENQMLSSNESFTSDILGNQYLNVFSIFYENQYIYGFIGKDYNIQLKLFRPKSGDFSNLSLIESKTALDFGKKISNPFKADFVPKVSFWAGVTGVNCTNICSIYIFLSQRSHSNNKWIERSFDKLIVRIGNDSNPSHMNRIQMEYNSVKNISSDEQIIAINYPKFSKGYEFLVFYSRNKKIEYCTVSLFAFNMDNLFDDKCLDKFKRQLLIDCSHLVDKHPEDSNIFIWIIIIIFSVVLIVLIGSIIWFVTKCQELQNDDTITTMISKQKGQSSSTVSIFKAKTPIKANPKI